jgi:hypothetical protein
MIESHFLTTAAQHIVERSTVRLEGNMFAPSSFAQSANFKAISFAVAVGNFASQTRLITRTLMHDPQR